MKNPSSIRLLVESIRPGRDPPGSAGDKRLREIPSETCAASASHPLPPFRRDQFFNYRTDPSKQVCVHDFVAGGMENTSLTILTANTLFPPETDNTRSSQGLVAHELAHQWFGDLVTCKDWSHLWLNEGFATYYEALFDGYKHGRDQLLYNLWNDAQRVLSVEDDTTPIVWRGFDDPGEQFSFRAYPKGAWVLHMLRSQLGEELFRRCIQTWLERHAYGVVVTEDLNVVLE